MAAALSVFSSAFLHGLGFIGITLSKFAAGSGSAVWPNTEAGFTGSLGQQAAFMSENGEQRLSAEARLIATDALIAATHDQP